MSVAVNIHLGQKLGANDPEGASNSYRVALSVICELLVQHTTFIATIYNIHVLFTYTHSSLPQG